MAKDDAASPLLILGDVGVGKSVLLRQVIGIEKPESLSNEGEG